MLPSANRKPPGRDRWRPCRKLAPFCRRETAVPAAAGGSGRRPPGLPSRAAAGVSVAYSALPLPCRKLAPFCRRETAVPAAAGGSGRRPPGLPSRAAAGVSVAYSALPFPCRSRCMRLLPVLALGALVLPLAARANDPNSYAQPDQVVVTHLDLDLRVDFPHKQLDGVATLKLDWKNPRAPALVLDTSALKVASVEAVDANGKTHALKYALAPAVKAMGSKLTIEAPKHPAQVRIRYVTSPGATGLQWLPPAQTADKKAPFMFSQSESTHARSW